MNRIQNPLMFITSLVIVSLFTIPALSHSLSLPHFFPNISSLPPPTNLTAAWESFQKLAGCHSGDKKAGLHKLKQYFQQFGYLNNFSATANYTDYFDDSLQSALKTYQLNFNLNCTGELDENTMKQILRPRCGVPDIVSGTSSMNSGGAPPSSPSHLGVVAHYSFFPGTPRWPARQTELTYAFSPENQLDNSVKDVFRTAFDRWSGVTPLTFTQTESFARADIRIGFFGGDHGDGEAFDGVLGTLAHAFSPPNGRLHLDIEENWVINSENLRSVSSAVDLESVVVHEIGHLLGLGHSSVEEAIMFPSISSGTKKVVLSSDDIDGIQALYGSNPNYNGSSYPNLQERESNDANFVGTNWLILAVGSVLFIL